MSDKRDLDSENSAAIDSCGAHLVHLLRAAQAEELFGVVSVAYHVKGGMLTKRVVQREATDLLLRASQQN